AQGGGGRVVRLAQGTAGKPQGLAGGSSQLQAAQVAVIDPLGPAQYGGATAGAQALLCRPQGFLLAGLNQYQPAQIDPGLQPGRRKGNEGRRHQHYPFPCPGQAGQGRPQLLQFATTGVGQQQFAQGRFGPAAAGQIG